MNIGTPVLISTSAQEQIPWTKPEDEDINYPWLPPMDHEITPAPPPQDSPVPTGKKYTVEGGDTL